MKIKYILSALLLPAMALSMSARDAKDIKVYINPGHGGHDADDRNVVIAPYTQGDPEGYWESNSNLEKGLALRDMLEAKGYTVVMSRVTNTSDDDLPLSTIVKLANNSGADIFFSIHSNATGTSSRRNFPLMLYRGWDDEPLKPQDRVVCEILNKQLLENQATYWTSTNLNIRGDWSFYDWGYQVGLGVLRGLTITGMLSEGSFHDYIPEAYRLMNHDFCWLEAWHFRKAIDEYFSVPGISTGVICGRLNDNRVPTAGSYIKYGDDKFATIQNARVELLDGSGKVIDTYTTDPVLVNGFYLFKDVQPGEYTVSVSVDSHYAQSEKVTVTADQVSYCNFKLSKVRSTPPVVESYSPVWNDGDEPVLCNTPIVIQFNWDMDIPSTEAAFKIDPPATGTFTWEDLNYRMVFTPTEPYNINTKYTVTIDASAKHAGGMAMESSKSFSFTTTNRNFMEILSSFPREGENVHYQNAYVEFRFDKLPNCSALNKQVTCTDKDGNKVSFNVRGMSNSKKGDKYGWFRIPFGKDLVVGEEYTLNVSGEMADKDGLTIKDPVSIKFVATNEGETKKYVNLIDDMNAADNYAPAENGSVAVTSSSVSSIVEKSSLFGTATLFTYAFTEAEGGEAMFKRSTEAETIISPDDKLGVHVNGDLSGNELYLEVITDISTQYIHVCDLDFLGWRYITVPAKIEAAGRLAGIKLVQVASQASAAGKVGIDDIVIAEGAGVEDIEMTSLTLHPNPCSEYLIANGGVTVTALELYNVAGVKVAQTAGNALNVSELPDGNYIAVVTTAGGRTSRQIVVKH